MLPSATLSTESKNRCRIINFPLLHENPALVVAHHETCIRDQCGMQGPGRVRLYMQCVTVVSASYVSSCHGTPGVRQRIVSDVFVRQHVWSRTRFVV